MHHPEYWQRVEEFVHQALGLAPADRACLLASIENPAIRAEVESLLQSAEAADELELGGIFVAAAARVISDDSLAGRRLGRFELVRRIGAGATSQVYLATDCELGREVALKLLSPHFQQAEQAERFRREAIAASALNHPNIVTIYDIGEDGGRTFLATEYIEGESLKQRLTRGPMEPAEAIAIAGDLASALSAAHARGILHRDISPNNIMIRRDGMVKLLDFGLARIESYPSSGHTLEGTLLGTPSHMSPEQARGLRVDERSDLWGLGVVLHEMLTGETAFTGDTLPDILVAVLERQPCRPSERNPAVSPALDRLVGRLLSKQPDGRPISAAEVQEELQRLADAPAQPGRSRLTAVIAIVMAAAGGFAWWRLTPSAPAAAPQPAMYQLTRTAAENRVTASAVSPDGKRMAYAELGGGLFLQDLESGSRRRLDAPPETLIGTLDWNAVSGELLISGEASDKSRAVWATNPAGSQLRLLRSDAQRAIVSPKGDLIAYTNTDQSEIWTMRTDGSGARKLVTGGGTDTFPFVLFSADGGRISYQRRHYTLDLIDPSTRTDGENSFRRTFETVDRNGAMVDTAPIRMQSACMLPDGRLIYLQSEELNGHVFNLWQAHTDLRTGKWTGEPRRLTQWPEIHLAGISCSADGRFVGVLRQTSQSDIYVAEATGRRLESIRRLTREAMSEYPHAWSSDGRRVIFERARNDGWDLYSQGLGETVASPLATGNGTNITPQLSPDGRWILYCSFRDPSPAARAAQKVMRIPAAGGQPEVVPTGPYDEFRCALQPGKRCVLRTVENRQYVYSELDPLRGRGRELARIAWTPSILGDWALSADGSDVAIPNHDPRQAQILLISLDTPSTRELAMPILGGLLGLVADRKGDGWFASARASQGVKLLHIGRDGRFQVLKECPIATWAIPSPDGRHVAFVDQALFANIWKVDLTLR